MTKSGVIYGGDVILPLDGVCVFMRVCVCVCVQEACKLPSQALRMGRGLRMAYYHMT